MKKLSILLVISFVNFAYADENGKMISSPINCQSSAFTSIQKVCSLVNSLGGSCQVSSDNCVQASQEIFMGTALDLNNVNDPRMWTGMGGLGRQYMVSAVCLMRDIADQPAQKLRTSASASTILGDVTAEQEVGFLSFNKSSAVYSGYHRLKACGPAVGCIDAYTQMFTLTPVQLNKQGQGKTAGQILVTSAYGLNLSADGLAQSLAVSLPGISVPTPIGNIEAKPEFRFGRATGFITAPFDGNSKSSFPDGTLGISSNKTYDIYGRNPGTEAMSLLPVEGGINSSPKGWISQIALGSRDADPKKPVWKQPGTEFPIRPDLDIKTARSKMEKTPNAYLGASIKATYSPIDLVPKPIRDIGCSGFLKICIDQLEVFAKPTIDVTYTSQIDFFQNEQTKWNGRTIPGTVGRADLKVSNLDQSKTASIAAASSAAARFALDAGLDFVIRLEINTFFTKIKKNLINIHPRTTLAESIKQSYSKPVQAATRSITSLAVANQKTFQSYVTFKGADLSSGASDGGLMHARTCLAKATPDGAMPPAPTYTPGNMQVLVDQIQYPCNICIGWEATPYKDDQGKDQVVAAQIFVMSQASQANMPVASRWRCRIPQQSGCYDMCKADSNGKYTIVTRTAIDMLNSGEAKDMPNTCARGQ